MPSQGGKQVSDQSTWPGSRPPPLQGRLLCGSYSSRPPPTEGGAADQVQFSSEGSHVQGWQTPEQMLTLCPSVSKHKPVLAGTAELRQRASLGLPLGQLVSKTRPGLSLAPHLACHSGDDCRVTRCQGTDQALPDTNGAGSGPRSPSFVSLEWKCCCGRAEAWALAGAQPMGVQKRLCTRGRCGAGHGALG